MEQFKYFGITLTYLNSIQEETKSRLKSWHAFYHPVQNHLSFRLLSRNIRIKIYRTIILPFVFYGCETWSLALREEHSLRVFENRVLRRIFGSKRDEVTGKWRKLHEKLNNLYSPPNIIWVMKPRKGWAGHVAGMRKERCIQGFGWETSGKETTWKIQAQMRG